MTQDWVKETEREIEKIKTWGIKDRLTLMAKLTFMNSSIASSVTGWNAWLTNAMIIEQFSEEELKVLDQEFQALALAFLNLDMKYTKLLQERSKKEKGKREKKDNKEYLV